MRDQFFRQLRSDSRGVVHVLAVVAAVFVLGSLATLIGVRTYQQLESARGVVAIEEEAEKVAYDKISIDEVVAVLPSDREPKPKEVDDNEKPMRSSAQHREKPPAPVEPKKDEQRDAQKKPRSSDRIKLSRLQVSSSGSSVVVQGTLPQTIAGTCQALLKPTDKNVPHEVHHIAASSSSQSSCSVSVPHSKLSSDYSSWRVYLSFYSIDKSVKAPWHYISDVSF